MKFSGKVVKGAGLGYKTANLMVEDKALLGSISEGVFIAKAKYGKKVYGAVAIKGVRPDIEVFLLDFNGNLYGEILEMEILEKMRELIRFENDDDLLRQIKADIKVAKEYFKNIAETS